MYVSREAVGQYEDKSLKPHRPKKIKRYVIKETSGNENKETSKCPICEGQPDIEECTTIIVIIIIIIIIIILFTFVPLF